VKSSSAKRSNPPKRQECDGKAQDEPLVIDGCPTTTTANSSTVVGATCASATDLARAAAGLPVADVPGGEVDARVDVAYENGKKDQATSGKATDHWDCQLSELTRGSQGHVLMPSAITM